MDVDPTVANRAYKLMNSIVGASAGFVTLTLRNAERLCFLIKTPSYPIEARRKNKTELNELLSSQSEEHTPLAHMLLRFYNTSDERVREYWERCINEVTSIEMKELKDYTATQWSKMAEPAVNLGVPKSIIFTADSSVSDKDLILQAKTWIKDREAAREAHSKGHVLHCDCARVVSWMDQRLQRGFLYEDARASGSLDSYGLAHGADGSIIFQISPFAATWSYEGGVVGEVPGSSWQKLGYPPPPRLRDAANSSSAPKTMIVSTPNMSTLLLPFTRVYALRVKTNGGLGLADPLQRPQWYFPDNPHVPFIPNLQYGDYAFINRELSSNDFVPDRGSAFADVGSLSSELKQTLQLKFDEVREEVVMLVNSQRHSSKKTARMQSSVNMLRDTVGRLLTASLSFKDTVILFGLYCRQYVDIKAWYSYFTKWTEKTADLNYSAKSNVNPPVDRSIMGCFTDQDTIAQHFYQLGVPVWYVRPPWCIKDSHVFTSQEQPLPPVDSLEIDWHPQMPALYIGLPGPDWYRASQMVMPAGLSIGLTTSILHEERQTDSGGSKSVRGKESVRFNPYRKDQTPGKKASGKHEPKFAIDTRKFLVSEELVIPRPTEVWSDALATILKSYQDKESNSVRHSLRNDLRGYPFPDPYVLRSGSGDVFAYVWLMLEGDWIRRLRGTGLPQVIPKPNEWRQIFDDVRLHFGLGVPPVNTQGRKANKDKRRVEAKLETVASIFGGPDWFKKLRAPPVVEFENNVIARNMALPEMDPKVKKAILWKVAQLNWQNELSILDQCILQARYKDQEWRVEREALMGEVFGHECGLFLDKMPLRNIGVYAGNVDAKARSIDAFRRVLSSWPGDGAYALKDMYFIHAEHRSFKVDSGQLGIVERRAVLLYCQTFFEWFGRAPTVPRLVPAHPFPGNSA